MIRFTEKKVKTIPDNRVPRDAWYIFEDGPGGIGGERYGLRKHDGSPSRNDIRLPNNLLDAVATAFKLTKEQQIYYYAGRFGYALLKKSMTDDEISETVYWIGLDESKMREATVIDRTDYPENYLIQSTFEGNGKSYVEIVYDEDWKSYEIHADHEEGTGYNSIEDVSAALLNYLIYKPGVHWTGGKPYRVSVAIVASKQMGIYFLSIKDKRYQAWKEPGGRVIARAIEFVVDRTLPVQVKKALIVGKSLLENKSTARDENMFRFNEASAAFKKGDRVIDKDGDVGTIDSYDPDEDGYAVTYDDGEYAGWVSPKGMKKATGKDAKAPKKEAYYGPHILDLLGRLNKAPPSNHKIMIQKAAEYYNTTVDELKKELDGLNKQLNKELFGEKTTVKREEKTVLKFTEAANLPAIAKVMTPANVQTYLATPRQDTIFATLKEMGLDPYINKLRNVVCAAPSIQDAPAIMQAIYAQFGVKSSVTITWEGVAKMYWDPKTPLEKPIALAYAKANSLPPPDPRRYLA